MPGAGLAVARPSATRRAIRAVAAGCRALAASRLCLWWGLHRSAALAGGIALHPGSLHSRSGSSSGLLLLLHSRRRRRRLPCRRLLLLHLLLQSADAPHEHAHTCRCLLMAAPWGLPPAKAAACRTDAAVVSGAGAAVLLLHRLPPLSQFLLAGRHRLKPLAARSLPLQLGHCCPQRAPHRGRLLPRRRLRSCQLTKLGTQLCQQGLSVLQLQPQAMHLQHGIPPRAHTSLLACVQLALACSLPTCSTHVQQPRCHRSTAGGASTAKALG